MSWNGKQKVVSEMHAGLAVSVENVTECLDQEAQQGGVSSGFTPASS